MTKCAIFKNFGKQLYVLGAQIDRLIETILLSTHNICFGGEIRKIIFSHPLSSRGLILCVSFFQYIPLPVLYGVFLYMGVAPLGSMQVKTKISLQTISDNN